MIGKRITKLARGIAEYEGWHPALNWSGNFVAGSCSWRNHNPGNLRSSVFQIGQCDGFAIFYSDEVGLMALIYDLYIKASGKSTTGLTAKSTIRELMLKYAPPSENDTESYISFLVQHTGLPETMTLAELLLE